MYGTQVNPAETVKCVELCAERVRFRRGEIRAEHSLIARDTCLDRNFQMAAKQQPR